MIAKRTARRRDSKSSFATLAKYIIRADAIAVDPGLDVFVSNCGFDDPALAIKVVESTQALNQRAKNDKTYHLVVSFPVEDKPSREQLVDIEQEIANGLGFGDHQRIAAIHRDTDHTHLHVAINKIHPESLNIVEPFRDFYVLDELCAHLEQKHNLSIDNRIDRETQEQARPSGRVHDMESHSGIQSFKTWILERKDAISERAQASNSWPALHEALAEYDLTIRPRGAGFVLASSTEKAFMKASDVDRSLSKGALEERLGAFSPPDHTEIELIVPNEQYVKRPLTSSPDLWAQYQAERQRCIAERHQGMQRIRARRDERIEETQNKGRVRRSVITNTPVSRRHKRRLHLDAAAERKGTYAGIRARYKQEVEILRRDTPIRTWSEFLVNEAVMSGNEKALAALRQQAQRAELNLPGLVGELRNDVFVGMKPKVTKHGDVLYPLASGRARDNGRKLSIEADDVESVAQGLLLAADKWGPVLSVDGDAVFKVKIAEAAVAAQLDVRFADPEIERRRQLLAELNTQQRKTLKQAAPQKLISDWIKRRNSVRAQDVLAHRLFTDRDAGDGVYKGTRRIAPGVQVVLIERNNQMLVVPISERQRSRFTQASIGQSVSVDRASRVNFGRRRGLSR